MKDLNFHDILLTPHFFQIMYLELHSRLSICNIFIIAQTAYAIEGDKEKAI